MGRKQTYLSLAQETRASQDPRALLRLVVALKGRRRRAEAVPRKAEAESQATPSPVIQNVPVEEVTKEPTL